MEVGRHVACHLHGESIDAGDRAFGEDAGDDAADLPPEERLPAAMQNLGISFTQLSDIAGHA